jgi:hypothetical protein
MQSKYFQNRVLVIATMHGKEQVLKLLLEEALGVTCIIPAEFNSDIFGTFSGEIERELNPLETARKKCYAAMELTGCNLAIASEGSFGAHPIIGFVPADEELLVLIDRKNNMEIKVKEISTATNFAGKEITNLQAAYDFAAQVLFPSHGLIIKKAKEDLSILYKGITDINRLKKIVTDLLADNHSIYMETDMRAMYNPSRMKVIEEACKKLITITKSFCKHCGTPGFSVTDSIIGLPCDYCGSPTRSPKAFVYTCSHCNYTEELLFPNGKETEDPMYCDRCNP